MRFSTFLQGFYAVYKDVFDKISGEDLDFRDDESDEEAPDFGNSESSYEEVVFLCVLLACSY